MASTAGQTEQQAINTKEELQDEWYDLLPIEKKLIGYTFGAGVILLVIFIFVFNVFR
jgi:hypothetical protein